MSGRECKPKGTQFPENSFWEKLERGERAVAVELDPPMGAGLAAYIEGARALRDAGADAVTLADSPMGRPRMDSCLLSCKLKRELGVEPLPHLSCRDRNRAALQGALWGLCAEGVHNILLVTGDPVPSSDRGEVKSVFNFNSRSLIRFASGLNEQLPAPFHIFAALNVNAPNFDAQLRLAREKEEAGAAGFFTQPVHSREALDNLRRARETLRGKLMGGVLPIVSHRNALFMNASVPGVRVCPELIGLYEGKSREEAEEIALKTSVRIAGELAPYTDGLYLITPFQRVPLMKRILGEVLYKD